MLGIYNYMTLALAISALVALGAFMLSVAAMPRRRWRSRLYPAHSFGVALYGSPLKWLVMLAPLGFVFFLSFRFEKMSQSALMGPSSPSRR